MRHEVTVYTHRWPSLQDDQLAQRATDQPTKVTTDVPDTDGVLYRD